MIGHILAVLNPFFRWRSAVTGRFVTRSFALMHPRETVREWVK